MPIQTETMFDNVRDCQFEMRRKASFCKLAGMTMTRATVGMYADEEGGGSAVAALEPQRSMIFSLNPNYTPTDIKSIQRCIVNHVEYTLARTRYNFTKEDCYRATAYSVRDRLIETLKDTSQYFFERDVKRCYYLSLEFLVGRAMQNALVNLDIEEAYKDALTEMGYNLEELYEYEHDAALGNGGLGRLAACFLDSMASLNYPCWGYGIRYTYGIFEQKIVNGRQVEHPDYWLAQENPWEVCRPDITYAIRFYGHAERTEGRKGRWCGGQLVQAIAYDNPVPGFDTFNCINLRLWKAAPSREFDFHSFNEGRYLDAIRERQDAECISAVLYPNDNNYEGKVLRLKQQYFFCCATIQDALRRFKKRSHYQWDELPSKVAFQLNDTHPTIAIPEMMRILVDIEGLEWAKSWELTKKVFAYTNHTVLPEALEKWNVDLFRQLLPRHYQIVCDINFDFLCEVRRKMDGECIADMSIFEEGGEKRLRMANLAVIGSHKVNGVAAIHSGLVRRDLFPHFVRYYDSIGEKDKFINVTNGVTPRRWIHCANRALSDLISVRLGRDEWLKDLSALRGLAEQASDPEFVRQWQVVKLKNKKRLAKNIEVTTGVSVDPVRMLFDVQVKRIHEYKRQTLNVFYMIHRYLRLKKLSFEERKKIVPRCSMIGGKAAPGYATAKTIIKMINNISSIINSDPEISQYYKVIYLPNYNVSQAQIIIPGADVNHQISTAGTEASGTSNMKFVMNGSLIIGTLDGATVEIREEGGNDTVFLFGLRENEVGSVRERARRGDYRIDGRLQEAYDWVKNGSLALGDRQAHSEFCSLVDQLRNNGGGSIGDFYLVGADFGDYCRAQDEVDRKYQNQDEWTKLAIKAAAQMGKFSTDRTIEDYASIIWNLQPAARPEPRPGKEGGNSPLGLMPASNRQPSGSSKFGPAPAAVRDTMTTTTTDGGTPKGGSVPVKAATTGVGGGAGAGSGMAEGKSGFVEAKSFVEATTATANSTISENVATMTASTSTTTSNSTPAASTASTNVQNSKGNQKKGQTQTRVDAAGTAADSSSSVITDSKKPVVGAMKDGLQRI